MDAAQECYYFDAQFHAAQEYYYFDAQFHAYLAKLRDNLPAFYRTQDEPRLVRAIEETFLHKHVPGVRVQNSIGHRYLCWDALSAATGIILSGERMCHEEAMRLVSTYPTFVNAMVDWVLDSNECDRITPLKADLARCTCLKKYRRDRLILSFHIPLPEDARDAPRGGVNTITPIYNDITIFLSYLVGTFTSTRVSKVNDRKAIKSKDLGFDRLASRMANGSELWFVCKSLFKCAQCSGALRLLREVATHLPTVFYPHIIEHRSFIPMFASNIMEMIQAAEKHQRFPLALSDDILRLSNFLLTIFRSTHFTNSDRDELFADEMDAAVIYWCTTRALVTLENNRHVKGSRVLTYSNLIFLSLAQIARDVYPWAEDVIEAHPCVENWPARGLHPLGSKAERMRRDASHVFEALERFKSSRRCMNIKCGKLPASSLKPFRRCAGCKLLSFCSKECQRDAWKGVHEGSRPHSELCKHLAALDRLWPRLINNSSTGTSADVPRFDLGCASHQPLTSCSCLGAERSRRLRVWARTRRPRFKDAEHLQAWVDSDDGGSKFLEDSLLLHATQGGYSLEIIREVLDMVESFQDSVKDNMGALGFCG